VSGEVDWRSAATIVPPTFHARDLEAFLVVTGDPTSLVRRGLECIPSPAWGHGEGAISRFFGTGVATHCFHVAPHEWAWFHEPQITAGFVHFLNDGNRPRRLARALALFQSAAACAGKHVDVSDVRDARCVAEENRTDILVELHNGLQPFGVSIEAKFGHALTRGQLPKALHHVKTLGWNQEDSIMLVVAPHPTDLDAVILRQNRKHGWRASSWWALLARLEQFIDQQHDCDDYRRFRRTVWHRAY